MASFSSLLRIIRVLAIMLLHLSYSRSLTAAATLVTDRAKGSIRDQGFDLSIRISWWGFIGYYRLTVHFRHGIYGKF